MNPAQSDDKSGRSESTQNPAAASAPNPAPANTLTDGKKNGGQTNEESKLKKKFESFKIWASGLRWIPTSQQELQASEKKILSHLERKHKGYFVDIGEPPKENADSKENNGKSETNKIWTLEMESPKSTKLPLVLVRGLFESINEESN